MYPEFSTMYIKCIVKVVGSFQEISGTYLSLNKHIIIGRGHPCVQIYILLNILHAFLKMACTA